MRRIIASALLIGATVVQSAYNNASSITFDSTLDCTSCIRGGYDFCLYTGTTNVTTSATSWDCNLHSRSPEAQVKNGTVTPNAYMCSNYISDQTNAIVNGCRPYMNANRDSNCGAYLVDLSLSNYFTPTVSIMTLARNTSCTYRAWTTCGYPSVEVGTNNAEIEGDFDISWAGYNGVARDEDINGWDETLEPRFNGSVDSSTIKYGHLLSETGYPNVAMIPK